MNLNTPGYLKDFPDFEQEGYPLCSKADPEMFFPVDAAPGVPRNSEVYLHEKEAKAICAECPLRVQCADYALQDPEIQGIWGGLTGGDRRRMLRRLRTRNLAKML